MLEELDEKAVAYQSAFSPLIGQVCFGLFLIETCFNQDMLDQNFVNKI